MFMHPFICIKDVGTINRGDELRIHSNQGWHYQIEKNRYALKEQRITQIMSSQGNCYDNAVIKIFLVSCNLKFCI